MRHLGPEAAAPFDADEMAYVNMHRATDGDECIRPVPAATLGMPQFKLPGRGEADHKYIYKNLRRCPARLRPALERAQRHRQRISTRNLLG